MEAGSGVTVTNRVVLERPVALFPPNTTAVTHDEEDEAEGAAALGVEGVEGAESA